MAHVSAFINARPFIPVSNDPDVPEVLTPATLLTQQPQQLKQPAGDWKPVTQAMKTCSTPNQCFLVAMEKRVPSHAATAKKVAKHDLQCAEGRLSSSPLNSVQRHPKQWQASCQNYLAQANRPTGGLSNHSGRLNEALQTTNYRNHPAEVGEPMNLAGLLTF